jgi:hypothetical protein
MYYGRDAETITRRWPSSAAAVNTDAAAKTTPVRTPRIQHAIQRFMVFSQGDLSPLR